MPLTMVLRVIYTQHCLSFLACFGWNPPISPCALTTEGYSQLEQPLFLRMSSGVVPKTNLTFCSTPCGQETHVTCRVFGGGAWEETHTVNIPEV